MKGFGVICAALLALSAPAAQAKVTLVSLMQWCLEVQEERVAAPFLMRRVSDVPEIYQSVTRSNVGPAPVTLTYRHGTIICEIDGTERKPFDRGAQVRVRWSRAAEAIGQSLEYLAKQPGIRVEQAALEQRAHHVSGPELYKCTGIPAVLYVRPRKISKQAYIVPVRTEREVRSATFQEVTAGPLQPGVRTEKCR